MKKYLLFAMMAMALLTCCENESNNPDDTNPSGDSVNPLKIIDAYDYSEHPSDLRYVSFRFVTNSVGYVTNSDSTVSLSGSGAIVDLLLVAQSVDDNHFPLAGIYFVDDFDSAFTASFVRHDFTNGTVIPAVYKVTDGEASAAISYNRGSVVVSGDNQNCTIVLSLVCQDGFTRNYEYHGAINVIDKSYQSPDVTGISFTANDPVELMINGSRTLHIEFAPSNATDNVQFTIDNPAVAQIVNTGNTNCEIMGVAKGNCSVTATCVHSQVSTSIQVSVKSDPMDENYVFHVVVMMGGGERLFTEERYCVYRLRKYMGEDIPDGGDAKLTRTVDNTRNIPNTGEWLYRYTDGGEEYGIFKDSVMTYRGWLLSTDAFFDAYGSLQLSSDFAPIMEFQYVFMVDSDSWYAYGNYEIVDDPTITDTIRPAGVAPKAMPGYIKSSHFNPAIYLSFFNDHFTTGNVDALDYPFFQMNDARMVAFWTNNDDDETLYNGWYFGTINSGSLCITDIGSMIFFSALSYTINTTLYSNVLSYCLQTETDDDGNVSFTEPLAMAQSKDVTFTNGSPQNVKKEFAPVRRRAFEKRMKVTNTIGAVLRMYLFSPKRIWRR